MAYNSHLPIVESGETERPIISATSSNAFVGSHNHTDISEKLKDDWDFLHHLCTVLARSDVHFARQLPSRSRVLDFEMNTGIWALEVAKKIEGEVVGFATSNLLPPSKYFPQNFSPILGNQRTLWEITDPFDLIHTRVFPCDKRDWPAFYRNAYEHLKPGGCLEQEALNLELLFKDPVTHQNLFLETLGNGDQYLDFKATKALLEGAGFVHVKEDNIELPINPREVTDTDRRTLSRAFNMALQDLLPDFEVPRELGAGACCTLVVWTANKRIRHW